MRRSPRMQMLVGLAAGLGMAWMMRHAPPASNSLFPACPIHAFFGVLCPGCGATRALAAMLAGEWSSAAQQNILILFLTPFAICGAAWQAHSAVLFNRWHPVRVPPVLVHWLLAAIGLFTLLRNIHIPR